MAHGTAEVLESIITDLRGYQPLTRGLSEPDAIFAAHPAAETNYPLAVIVTVISDTSTPHRGAYTKTWRVQVTARGKRPWLEARDQDAQIILNRVLDAVGERLDRARGIDPIPLGGETGAPPEAMDDGSLALARDWRIRGFPLDV